MAVTAAIYNAGLAEILKGINFEVDDIKVAILNTSYTPNVDTDINFDDVNTNEISSSGYTAGGKSLTGLSVYQDDINDRAYIEDMADVVWTSLTASNVRYLVFYKNKGTAATSVLLFYLNLGTTYNLAGQDFSILPTLGVLLRLLKA